MPRGYSIGVANTVLDGTDLGSLTSASIDVQATTVPTHRSMVGEAKILADGQIITSMRGTLNMQCEEFSLLTSFIGAMRQSAYGYALQVSPFTCTMPFTPATFSGLVAALPQFSITTSPSSWGACNMKAELVGPLDVTAGSYNFNTYEDISGAITKDSNNLCFLGAELTGFGIIRESSLDVSCQFRPIFRGPRMWAVDYVIDSVNVKFTGSVEPFDDAQLMIDDAADLSLKYQLLGGQTLDISLGSKCAVILGGMKSSNSNWNTQSISISGTEF